MTKLMCNLCGQEFDKNDPDIHLRMERHEQHHDQSIPHGSYNQTWGKVDWIAKD